MKFNKLFILKLSPDKVIHDSAKLYQEYSQIPLSRKWCNMPADGWNTLTDECFLGQSAERPTMQDKIMIVAHGTPTYVGGGVDENGKDFEGENSYTAEILALAMSAWGIKEAGLITFKCCNVASGNFLEQFVGYAGKRDRMKIGWVKGYTGLAATDTKMFTGKPTEDITVEVELPFFGKVNKPIYGDSRFKVVRGTHPFAVPNSKRYVV